ncbi:NPCBM/NEW2 domain-containing protein, partial [Actinacidiphila oryziradicis]|uniref:NPCBM/NEW2 domain-containing protein n=1 Tax=Actinacidiphila oryziradicis TaxID=2571141 RepID=UPI0023F55731
RSHFSMWSVMAAPLLIGSDLRSATPATYDILGNREVIAVDQDPLGKQGTVFSSDGGRWVVTKETADGSRTVALFNETSQPQRIGSTAAAVGLPDEPAYRLRDLWQHKDYNTAGAISATVPAHGTVLYRTSVSRRWASYSPAVELGTGGTPFIKAGTPATLTTVVTDLGRTPARSVRATLTAPDGWQVRATSPTTAHTPHTGRKLTTSWSFTAPPGAASGTYPIALTAVYRSPTGIRATSGLTAIAYVVVPPPSGASYVSDLTWLSATNRWGPVEKDTSVGESAAGDGHPITIGGAVYAKGLGAHALSTVEYYLGAHCTSLTAQIGVDDEKGSAGTVAFEVWADGQRVAATGVLTNADPAQTLSAEVTGADTVQLVVTDGGDGVDSDHADWADTRLSCAAA